MFLYWTAESGSDDSDEYETDSSAEYETDSDDDEDEEEEEEEEVKPKKKKGKKKGRTKSRRVNSSRSVESSGSALSVRRRQELLLVVGYFWTHCGVCVNLYTCRTSGRSASTRTWRSASRRRSCGG